MIFKTNDTFSLGEGAQFQLIELAQWMYKMKKDRVMEIYKRK